MFNRQPQIEKHKKKIWYMKDDAALMQARCFVSEDQYVLLVKTNLVEEIKRVSLYGEKVHKMFMKFEHKIQNNNLVIETKIQ